MKVALATYARSQDDQADPGAAQVVRPGPVSRLLILLIHAYQRLFSYRASPCRFVPTCSSYAEEAIETHGALRGPWLAVRRVGRCHPWGGHGYDPVPPAKRAGRGGS